MSRLQAEPDLLERVEAAERLGISLRRFDGWEPTTHYEYDGDRLATSTPESEWTEPERAWMVALGLYRSTRCPCGCGEDVRVSTAAESDGLYRVGPGTRCHARTALSIAQKAQSESPQPEAFLYKLERR